MNTYSYYTLFGSHLKTRTEIEKWAATFKINLAQDVKNEIFYHPDLGFAIPLISDNTVLMYVCHPISNVDSNLHYYFDVLDSDEKKKKLESNNKLKLLAQTAKVIKTVPMGSRLSPKGRHHQGGIPVKIHPKEVIKAILLGYLALPTDAVLVNACVAESYDLRSTCNIDRNTNKPSDSLKVLTQKVDNMINKNSHHYYRDSLVSNIGALLTRTTKAFNEEHVLKWRKPPKNSIWPWTELHHWHEVQESPITLANFTYKALVGGNTSNSYNKKSTIDQQYPVFNKPLNLEYGRKILEAFFESVINNRSKSAWGDLVYRIDNMKWGNLDNPCYMIPRLCLIMGVYPQFDDSGKFIKFLPLAENLKLPTKKIYIESPAIDIDCPNVSLEQYIALTTTICYELGLIQLDTLEKILGLIDGGSSLANSPNFVQMNLGKHVVCCIPETLAYDASSKAMLKLQTAIDSNVDDVEAVY